ncbi:MAG: prolyl aminopeptidase, partial [Vicinamibacterales bacterium]
EPRESGFLDSPDGHRVYYEWSGNPAGEPVLFLHGGPGSSCKPDHRRYFDPAFYRIVLFDQRGCGRSEPSGALRGNSTPDLVADIERIRERLGVARWILFGGSWGSALALAYAQAHPARVRRMILRGIFLASRSELDWYFVGLRQFLPESWERLYEGCEPGDWDALLRIFDARLHDVDIAAAMAAAARWNAYEAAIMSIGQAPSVETASPPDASALARARVQVRYLLNGCYLDDGQLLREIGRVAHIPAVLLHGRQDFVCPPITAHALARAWPAARLTILPRAGHASSHPDLERALVAATDAVRDELRARHRP